VLAHELGHVRNRDILTSSSPPTLAGAITMLAALWRQCFGRRPRAIVRGIAGGGILMMILAPFAATLIQTRGFPFAGIRGPMLLGAHVTGNPYALASACKSSTPLPGGLPLPAFAFDRPLFIVSPLLSGGQPGQSLFYPSAEWRAVLSASPAGLPCSIDTPL